MRYSIEPKDRIYVKGYGSLSLAKNISTDATKVAKVMSNKYSQKRLHSAKKYTIHATKTTSRRAIQKTGEATGDLIGNKIADKRTSISNSSQMMKLIMKWKYQMKDIYLHKKDIKLLIN